MKTIVITGSTRGIGFGLARAFLERGCRVAVSSRTQAAVEAAAKTLEAEHEPERILSMPCDVTSREQVQSLWDAAQDRFGAVDVWINNAGMAHAQTDLWSQDPAEVRAVVNTNVTGAIYGAQVALEGMLRQGSGAVYNMEGMGSDGRWIEGLTTYGITKRALNYLSAALVRETKGTPVIAGALSPGMVATGMLTKQYETRPPEDWERAKRIFNILAERVDVVAPWLADRVLKNDKTGVRFKYLSTPKLIGRFVASPFRKRDLFG